LIFLPRNIFTIGFELVVKPPTRHTSFEFQNYPCHYSPEVINFHNNHARAIMGTIVNEIKPRQETITETITEITEIFQINRVDFTGVINVECFI
jgi:hypothetical protein